MKRLLVSALTAFCTLGVAATAHASYVERLYMTDPDWQAGEQTVEGEAETTTNDFNETSDADVKFGEALQEIHLNASASITRAEFTALLVRSLYPAGFINRCYWDITSVFPPRFELLFRDVHVNDDYAPEICVAMREGLVRGYGNDIFRPEEQITMADAAKILARSHGLTPWADQSKPAHWFDTYIEALSRQNAIPLTITRIEARISVADATEMIGRLRDRDRSKPSRTAEELIARWEATYNPPRRVAVVDTRMKVPKNETKSTTSQTTSKAPAKAAQTSSKAAVRSEAAASVGPSSREKAWYEF